MPLSQMQLDAIANLERAFAECRAVSLHLIVENNFVYAYDLAELYESGFFDFGSQSKPADYRRVNTHGRLQVESG